MSQTPDKKDHDDDHALSPKGQRKVSIIAIAGIAVVAVAIMAFVVISAFLNGA